MSRGYFQYVVFEEALVQSKQIITAYHGRTQYGSIILVDVLPMRFMILGSGFSNTRIFDSPI